AAYEPRTLAGCQIDENKRRWNRILSRERIEPHAWLDSTRGCCFAISTGRRPKTDHAHRKLSRLRSHHTRTNLSRSLSAFATTSVCSIATRRHGRRTRRKTIRRCNSSFETRPWRRFGVQLLPELH